VASRFDRWQCVSWTCSPFSSATTVGECVTLVHALHQPFFVPTLLPQTNTFSSFTCPLGILGDPPRPPTGPRSDSPYTASTRAFRRPQVFGVRIDGLSHPLNKLEKLKIICISYSSDTKRKISIDIRYHFIRELIERGKLVLSYIPSADNITEMFTKALPSPQFRLLAWAPCIEARSPQGLRGSVSTTAPSGRLGSARM
jgi:hypothetical protein